MSSRRRKRKAQQSPIFEPPRADIAGSLAGFHGDDAEGGRFWTDGVIRIPRAKRARNLYDVAYIAAVRRYYEDPREPARYQLELAPILVFVGDLVTRNAVANRARYELYLRILRAGEQVPPIVVEERQGGFLEVIDGNHRTQAARDAGVPELPALLMRRTPV